MQDSNKNFTLPSSAVQKKWHRRKGPAAILILVLAAAAATGVLIYRNKNLSSAVKPLPSKQPASAASLPASFSGAPSQTASSTEEVQNFINSVEANPPKAKVLDDKYGIFMDTSGDQINHLLNGFSLTTRYKDDGVVSSGPYAGYNRLAAFASMDDPGGGYTYIFATKDYQTFILDTGTYPFGQDPASDLKDPDTIFNKAKVTLGSVPGNFPATIDEGNFVLIRSTVSWDAASRTGTPISSNTPGLTFYSEPMQFPTYDAQRQDAGYQSLLETEQKYISAQTGVTAQDQFGLAYSYNFISKEEFKRGAGSVNNYDLNFYKLSDISSAEPLYQEYGQLFPGGCGQALANYVLQNISGGDLVKVAATLGGVDLYTLKDQNNPLNREEYYSKITLWKDEFSQINNNEAVPSYEAYVAKNPVLIFQDSWGRLVALGEWQYQTGGGCGKPVIYLYPPKPTEVTVSFVNPMRFGLDIPTYNGQWDVLANPDGHLKDLQPAATDCGKINYGMPGSGYAKEACAEGIYPYLYWEGQASGVYPKADGGWVVAKNDLTIFLDGKLSEIGLNEKETRDMVSYWVPQLLLKNAPYYRLAFFQNQTMDNFIPMQVTPKPDATIRVFLDWSPLAVLPSQPPLPEVLTPAYRKGFTLVEWGGLK